MILGRVSKGKGGDIMLDTAKKVLEASTRLDFSELPNFGMREGELLFVRRKDALVSDANPEKRQRQARFRFQGGAGFRPCTVRGVDHKVRNTCDVHWLEIH